MPSVDGLISGLDTTGLIKDILKYQQAPIDQLKARIKTETQKKTSYLGITARLLGLQTSVNAMVKVAELRTPTVVSSDENVLKASGAEDLPAGSYSFRIRQLAEAGQVISNGFGTANDAVGAGTIKIDQAGGRVERDTELDLLNGGNGVRRGSIRVNDRAGNSEVIDLSTALTVRDVIDAINNAAKINVTASISAGGGARPGEAILLSDSSGGAGALRVDEVSGGKTAADLGLTGAAAGATLEGSSVMALGRSLQLRALNDGLGIRVKAGADLSITQADGASFQVDLTGKTTLGQVIDAINTATGNTSVTVSISGRKLVAADSSSGGSTFSIAGVNGGSTAADLGLSGAASGGTITGDPILADLGTVLLKSLRGGSGVSGGSVLITNRAGASAAIDLSAARSVGDVLRAINGGGISVEASVNDTGDGILLTDSSGGSGLLKVEEVSAGSTASQLGILNAAGVSANEISGDDLNLQYLGENTLLATLNGGRGIYAGSIRVSDPSGRSFNVDLSQEQTIGDVLQDINGAAAVAGSDVVAALNASGNGISLTATTGSGLLRVSELNGGSTAKDLGLPGVADAGTPLEIDGSFERSITITSTDTLTTIADKINAAGVGVSAAVLSDGSSLAPQRLQLVSQSPGAAGGLIVRTAGGTSLAFSTASSGRDSVLFLGGETGRPVIVRSTTNVFKDVPKGLTVTALSASDERVTVTASKDLDKVSKAIQDFVDGYNAVIDEISAQTRFDLDPTNQGLLIGEGSLRSVETSLSDAVIRQVTGLGNGANLASNLGLKVVAGGKLSFDAAAFDTLAAAAPDSVRRILTQARVLENSTKLADFQNGAGVSTTTAGAELRIQRRDGSAFDVDLNGAATLRDVLAAINNAAGNGGTITAAISSSGRSIALTDSTSGSSVLRVESLNSSPAYKDLGLDRGPDSTGGGTITGREVDLTRDPGVGRRLTDTLASLLDPQNGLLQTRADFFQKSIDDLNTRMTRQQESLASRETTLRNQFAQLEVLLGQNQSLQQRLSASFGQASTSK